MNFGAHDFTNVSTRRRILLVDDDPRIRIALASILEVHGYEVETASGVHEAACKLDTQVFDLIITDLTMETEFAGYDVIRCARRQQYHPAIIVLSAAPFFGNDGCVDASFVKGNNVVEFLCSVEILLKRTGDREAFQETNF